MRQHHFLFSTAEIFYGLDASCQDREEDWLENIATRSDLPMPASSPVLFFWCEMEENPQ